MTDTTSAVSTPSGDKPGSNPAEKNLLEWIVFGMGCVMTCATIGCLIWQIYQVSPRDSPVITIDLGDAVRQSQNFSVPVTVTNSGDQAAEQLRIEVVLLRAQGPPERAVLRFDSLPGHGSAQGFAGFRGDPHTGRLEGRAVGYTVP